jgi:hypothetical protein
MDDTPLTKEERIALGKLCGCERCVYCEEWRVERVTLNMLDMVKRAKEIAEEGRREWMVKHINRS